MARTPLNWHHPRSDLASRYLRMYLDVGTPSVVLFAPRGQGKTQFVMKDLIPAARDAGMLPIYVNLWADNSRPAETVVEALVNAALEHQSIPDRIKDGIRALKFEMGIELEGSLPGIGKGKVSAKASKGDAPPLQASNPLATMRQLATQLVRAHPGRLLMIFDEVQTLAAKPEHETFVRSLRTLLDSNRDTISSLFTGSSQSRLTDLFQRIKAPLYSFARNDTLPTLGDDFLQHWLKNIKVLVGEDESLTLDRMRKAFAMTECNPRIFWSAVSDMVMVNSSDIERYTRSAVSSMQSNSGVLQRLRELTPLDRVVLTEIVKWEMRIDAGEVDRSDPMRIYHQETRQAMASVLGITPTPQQVQTSLRRLSGNDLQLVVSLDRGVYQVEDPLFVEALADVLIRNTEGTISPAVLEIAADEATTRQPRKKVQRQLGVGGAPAPARRRKP